MSPIEASLLTVLCALSAAAGCTRTETGTRSRSDDQATIVFNASGYSAPAAATPQEQIPEKPASPEQAQTIVIEPHAALEPAKVESVVAPVEVAPSKAPNAPQAKAATVSVVQPAVSTAPSADNADLAAVVNELSDLLRDLTAPGGKAEPESPLMKSIRSGNAPRPATPPSDEH